MLPHHHLRFKQNWDVIFKGVDVRVLHHMQPFVIKIKSRYKDQIWKQNLVINKQVEFVLLIK